MSPPPPPRQNRERWSSRSTAPWSDFSGSGTDSRRPSGSGSTGNPYCLPRRRMEIPCGGSIPPGSLRLRKAAAISSCGRSSPGTCRRENIRSASSLSGMVRILMRNSALKAFVPQAGNRLGSAHSSPSAPTGGLSKPKPTTTLLNPGSSAARLIFMFEASSSVVRRLLVCLIALSSPLVAQVRIMEMLPASSNFPDDDGTPQGWIELWNSHQINVATLTGYKLSNGTTTWTFPDIQMVPDERIVIWASAKNRTTATAPLHTNFTLSAGGGTVSLSDASDNLLSRLQDVPALSTNLSWGRDEWDTAVTPAATGFYASPTPGERNNFTGSGVSGQVSVDIRSRSFTGTLSVAITTSSVVPGTVIRYTTDRSVPTNSSAEYTAPITISNTTMLRARAFSPDLLPGATATEGYLLLDGTAASFTSTMPLVVVSNFLNSPPPTDKSDQSGFMWVWQPASSGATVRFTDTPVITSRVRLSRRGSSTLNNPKFNLSIEARNAHDDDERDVQMLGMKSHSDWIFHAPYSYDPALLRNPFIHDLSNQLGHWAPHHKMAEVFLDFSSSGLRPSGTTNEYFGIYNILE
ncbi:MAG: hypothetical protein EOP87_01860, partial [Verrucomicrobiaceae bacterium]